MRYPPEDIYRRELLKQSTDKDDRDRKEKTIEELIKEFEDDVDE
jgi:hypothetical protein